MNGVRTAAFKPIRPAIGLALGLVLLAGCSSKSTSPTSPTPPPVIQNMYVSNSGVTPAVLTFPLTATGNAAPANTITGAATGLGDPHRVAFDSNNNIYVTNMATEDRKSVV
jgi:hypothetical protein